MLLGIGCSKIQNTCTILMCVSVTDSKKSVTLAHIKRSKFECAHKPHSTEHFQSVPHVLGTPSIWLLEASPSYLVIQVPCKVIIEH